MTASRSGGWDSLRRRGAAAFGFKAAGFDSSFCSAECPTFSGCFLKRWEFLLRVVTARSSAMILADFNNPVAGLEAGLDFWPRTLESCEERCSTTVAEPNPDEFDFGVALLGEVEEVFVFANDDASLKFGVAANGAIRGVAQARLKYVLAVESAVAQMFGESDRQLVIDDKFHDVGSTTWSV
jgi:hypothetical protein